MFTRNFLAVMLIGLSACLCGGLAATDGRIKQDGLYNPPAPRAQPQPQPADQPTPPPGEGQPAPQPVKLSLKETPVADIDAGMITTTLVASPDLRRAAYVARPAGQKTYFVVLDGVQGKPYDAISMLTFSPDSKRFACAVKSGEQYFVVADGAEGKPYDYVSGITFSPDSKRLAYKVKPKNEESLVVVADGAEGKRYSSVGALVFSPDSAHLAHSTWSDYGNKGGAMVVDGTAGKVYNGTLSDPVFSPDSKRMAYGVSLFSEKKQMVVLDGAEGKAYDNLCVDVFTEAKDKGRHLLFSPDSGRFAYFAMTGGKWLAVADGAEGKAYNEVRLRSLVFSPDSKRLAYAACAGNQWIVALDGNESTEKYSDVIDAGLVFSPDSKRFAYCTVFSGFAGVGSVVYIDGVAQKVFQPPTEPVVFSPDSKRAAFAGAATKNAVTVDGAPGAQYDEYCPGTLAFTPDSKHVAYLARKDAKWKIIVDAAEAGEYDSLVGGGKLIIDTPAHLHAMMIRGGKIYLVEIEITE